MPTDATRPIVIVLAEDDEDDYLLTTEALEAACLANKLVWVKDGEQLLSYLRSPDNLRPGLILLDLNMPRMDGREALEAIKSDPILKTIPVVVLTTSRADEDVVRTYNLGVNSYIRKPVEFDRFTETVRMLGKYWFQIVELPR